jgi:hypothetical protein
MTTEEDVITESHVKVAHEIGPNFIYMDFLKQNDICDSLIEYFNYGETYKTRGVTGLPGGSFEINSSNKDSLDHNIDLSKELHFSVNEYLLELKQIIDDYLIKYPFANISNFGLVENPNIQFYFPKGGYKKWHCERSNGSYPSATRHLVFMTYLNDVTDEGETEFLYQNIKVKPKKGLTVVWPADWTHFHRGIPSPTQEKYIITGWINFYT